MTNILFTCAGRRNYLLRYFREALAGRGSIFAADMDVSATAMKEADERFVVPSVSSDEYLENILQLCDQREIDLVVPLNDLELPLLAANRHSFDKLGTRVLVSNESVIDICFDKVKTNEFLSSQGLKFAQTFTSLEAASLALEDGRICFPLIVKPRWGSASIQIYKVYSEHELNCAFDLAKTQIKRSILVSAGERGAGAVLIQETLPGTEYGVDVLNDFDGNVQCVYIKQKLGMRAGETEKSRLVQNAHVELVTKKMAHSLAHIGNLDCDIFVDGDVVSVLELNPRFGGGYPFSHTLGADFPSAIVSWVLGDSFEVSGFHHNYNDVISKHDNLMTVFRE